MLTQLPLARREEAAGCPREVRTSSSPLCMYVHICEHTQMCTYTLSKTAHPLLLAAESRASTLALINTILNSSSTHTQHISHREALIKS